MNSKTLLTNKRILLLFVVLVSISVFATNPSSSNYALKQWAFATGNDTGDKPESTNYILPGSAIGTISGEDASSSNYGVIPGYYLGPIIGEILPPENVTIEIVGTDVVLNWDAVTGANSYKIYSNDDPHEVYTNWNFEEEVTATTWSESIPSEKKFYYVTANSSSRTVTKDRKKNNH